MSKLESVSPAGLRARAQIQREKLDESCARHLELAADEIERLRKRSIGDARLKQAKDAMDWFGLNRSWLMEATAKWYSHQKGLEIFDKLKELDDAREQLRQMYVSGR